MRNDWNGKVTNLVQTESKTVNHSSDANSLKIALQRLKIPKLEEICENEISNPVSLL